MMDQVLLRAEVGNDLEDPILCRLAAEAALDPSHEAMRTSPTHSSAASVDEGPFVIALAKPQAFDLHRLWRIANLPIPAALRASLGPKKPLLLLHAITVFHK